MVRRILALYVPGRSVVAFGSRVTNTAKPTSDLDLCIMGDEPLPSLLRQQLLDAFAVSLLPFKVDVIEWASLTPGFRAVIQRTAIPVRE